MNYNQIYKDIVLWHENYVKSYMDMSEEIRDASVLKYEHTQRVCKEIELLCKSINANAVECAIAGIIASLHDIARYEQFRIYSTFSDHHSINHAELAIEIIEKHSLLSKLEPQDAKLISQAVLYHNSKTIPESFEGAQKKYCQLIRDADKLDIFRIVTSQYQNPDFKKNKTIQLGLSEERQYTPEVCACVEQGCIVDYAKIKCINDFKLVQIGWVYDLNFDLSFTLLNSRGHFQIIKNELPDSADIKRAVSKAEKYLLSKINGELLMQAG